MEPGSNGAQQKSKFKPGGQVCLNESGSRSGLQGPFLIEKVASQGKYTLCFEDGRKAKNGKEFAEKELVKQ